MRVLVTGARGKVGSSVAATLHARGHEVHTTDIGGPDYRTNSDWRPPYVRADLCNYGEAVAVVMKVKPDVVVHTAGIPGAMNDVPSTIFHNNTLSTFNVAEAVARTGVSRVVNISSETVAGYVTAEISDAPDYLPVDEEHPLRPQDAYALSKSVGESICDALTRRSTATAVSIRATYVIGDSEVESVRAIFAEAPLLGAVNGWAYILADDLAELAVLCAESDTPGHEVIYAAAAENTVGLPLADLVSAATWTRTPEVRECARPDASGINSAKATRLFGWSPSRSIRFRRDAQTIPQAD